MIHWDDPPEERHPQSQGRYICRKTTTGPGMVHLPPRENIHLPLLSHPPGRIPPYSSTSTWWMFHCGGARGLAQRPLPPPPPPPAWRVNIHLILVSPSDASPKQNGIFKMSSSLFQSIFCPRPYLIMQIWRVKSSSVSQGVSGVETEAAAGGLAAKSTPKSGVLLRIGSVPAMSACATGMRRH